VGRAGRPSSSPGRRRRAAPADAAPAVVPTPPLWRRPWARELALVSLPLLLGLAVRLWHVLPASFPLNDGGMFYAMASDVQRHGFRLPDYTSYNGLRIPFAYPPLAFYLAAALDLAGPWSLADVLRFLPPAASVLSIGVLYLLARAMMGPGPLPLAAACVFALAPRSFTWQIVGGGLTRSLGLLLALLALWQGYLMFRQGRGPRPLAIVLAALALLTHPEMGWLVACSYAFFFLALGRQRAGVLSAAVSALAVAALTTPWWLTVLLRHGPDPLLSAVQSGKTDWLSWKFINLLQPYLTDEPFFPLLALLMYAGGAIAGFKGQLFLPLWFLLILYIDPRVAYTSAMVPGSLLAGVAVVTLLELAQREGTTLPLPRRLLQAAPRWRAGALLLARPWPLLGLLLLLTYGTYSSLKADRAPGSPLVSLPAEARVAMSWIASSTPGAAQFIIVHGDYNPWIDAISEWFPALTGRVSVATVQGSEWLGLQRYNKQQFLYWTFQDCAYQESTCLDRWAYLYRVGFTHVFLPRVGQQECCPTLRDSLRFDPNYRLIYDGPGGAIYERERPDKITYNLPSS
jgi:hypothetical protein